MLWHWRNVACHSKAVGNLQRERVSTLCHGISLLQGAGDLPEVREVQQREQTCGAAAERIPGWACARSCSPGAESCLRGCGPHRPSALSSVAART